MTCSFQDMSRRTGLLLAFALAAWVALGSHPTRAADLETAREQFKTGRYEECLQSAQKAIEEGAYQTEWRLLALESMMALGRYDEAAERVDSILRQMRPSIRLLKLAHEVYQHNGQDDQAKHMLSMIYRIATMRRAEYMSDDDVVALGEALLLLGAEPRMVLDDFYNRAMRHDPECRSAYLAAGNLALAKQDYELAAERYRDALTRFGDDPDLHYGLAQAFYYSDRAVMLGSLDAALHVNPNHAEALILRAEHLIDCESYDAAAQSLERVLARQSLEPCRLGLSRRLGACGGRAERSGAVPGQRPEVLAEQSGSRLSDRAQVVDEVPLRRRGRLSTPGPGIRFRLPARQDSVGPGPVASRR